jgi:7-carboxy-7-deazaguanine synthase
MIATFNIDRNVRRKDYEKLEERTLAVTKIFGPTIQGEGPFAGHCAVFVRLAGCNLGAKKSCPWCDTDFALRKAITMTVEQILQAANAMKMVGAFNRKLMVLTGGEPLMQPYVTELIRFAILDGWTVQLETNGYFCDQKLIDLIVAVWFTHKDQLHFVVSPKVNARGRYPTINPTLLHYSACLKILVEDVEELEDSPYSTIPEFAHEYARNLQKPVYISPINWYRREPHPNQEVVSAWGDTPLDIERCKRNAEYAAKLVVQYGYRLNLQQHLFAGMP